MGSLKRPRVTKRRFAAKLLFQYRIVVNGKSNHRRQCLERLILIEAPAAEAAHRLAMKAGRQGQFRFKDRAGNPVHFEFVGILDLLELLAALPDEVWYDIRYMLMPKERSERILPPKPKLRAIRWATSNNRWRGP